MRIILQVRRDLVGRQKEVGVDPWGWALPYAEFKRRCSECVKQQQ
jgi:hypothetical protein